MQPVVVGLLLKRRPSPVKPKCCAYKLGQTCSDNFAADTAVSKYLVVGSSYWYRPIVMISATPIIIFNTLGSKDPRG